MINKRKEKFIIGIILVIVGVMIMISTLTSGVFYSKITLNSVDNAVYVSGIGGQKKIAPLVQARSFKMKTNYKKGFFSAQGSLCYNLEMTKADGEKEEIFPFCVASSEKMKSIAKKASSFLENPKGFVFSSGVFSLNNLILFFVALFAVLVGASQISSARKM